MKSAFVIIEDHPLYREALQGLLKTSFPTHKIRAETSLENGCRAIGDENKRSKYKSIVLLDLTLPDVSGIAAAYRIKEQFPENPLVIVSASDDYLQVTSCLNAGALLFINKAAPPSQIVEALKLTIDDDLPSMRWISAEGPRSVDLRHAIKLTDRQRDVLRLVCEGKTNREIAEELNLAEITAKAHVSAIFRELKVVNRTQALLAAQRLGFLVGEDS